MAVAAVWNIVAQQLITQVRQGFIKTLPAHICVIQRKTLMFLFCRAAELIIVIIWINSNSYPVYLKVHCGILLPKCWSV